MYHTFVRSVNSVIDVHISLRDGDNLRSRQAGRSVMESESNQNLDEGQAVYKSLSVDVLYLGER